MKNVDNTRKPTVLSFCSGIRGLERGLERAIGPVREVCFVEIEAFICANLVYAMEAGILDPAPIWTDAKTFSAVSAQFRNKVHIITGGYPCTPFSLAGKRAGEADPRHLWPYLREAVESIRPVLCFFENVDDHLTMGFDTVYKDLRALDYTVEAGIFTAEEAGAPHERGRLFILAMDNTYLTQSAQGRLDLREVLGVPENKWSELRSVIPGGTSDQKATILDNASSDGFVPDDEISTGRDRLVSPGEGMGNSKKSELKQPKYSWRRFGRPSDASTILADSCFPRSPQWQSIRGNFEPELKTTQRDRWPAGPGQPQHPWEHPRTISREAESEMGLSAHGYSFREDLLRALGNSVVEQQAELAFRTLIQRFI